MSSNGLESKTVNELKELAKDLGIKGISKYKKAELIEEIEKISPSYIEKDGVILRERISLNYHLKMKMFQIIWNRKKIE